MVRLVDNMMSLQLDSRQRRTEQEKLVVQHQINGIDRQIDQLVYELYGLTDEEIAVVEGSM
jgi:hypothetical protein